MASKKEYITDSLIDTAAVTITAGVIAGVVGYREQSGKPEEELMPHLGPIPMDLGIGVAAHLIGFGFAGAARGEPSKWCRVANKVGDGAFAVFGVTAGQSVGASLYDSMNKGSAGRAPQRAPQQMPAPAGVPKEYRGADGRHQRQPAPAQQWARQAMPKAA